MLSVGAEPWQVAEDGSVPFGLVEGSGVLLLVSETGWAITRSRTGEMSRVSDRFNRL